MTTVTHDPARFSRERALQLLPREMWGCIAIVAMWLAVLFDAVFGPDVRNSSAGGDSSSVPSVIPVALFAFLATWVVARYAFRRSHHSRGHGNHHLD